MGEKPSVTKIFKELLYEPCQDRREIPEETFLCSETPPDLVNIYEIIKAKEISGATPAEVIFTAQEFWSLASRQSRANTLHKIWQNLKSISNSRVKLKDEISTFADYFDFYCDALHQNDEYIEWKPEGLIYIMIHNYAGMFVVAATVSAALAAGCSVLVKPPEEIENFFMFLQAIFIRAGLPEGVFMLPFDGKNAPLSNKITKFFTCGSSTFSPTDVNSAVNFFCPNNTAALVLESADLNAAADKIIAETWCKEYPSFAVSNVIVQEAIYEEFLYKLKSKMHQMMTEKKYCRKFLLPGSRENIKKIISEAIAAGASVEEVEGCAKMNPTVIVNYHNQDTDCDVPVLKLLLCRTAKEGVSLLNNCRYTLGTSIWSETSSQALEISSQLISPNVWVNCHGKFHPSVPFQLSGNSGNCVLGGMDGVLEYLSLKGDDLIKELLRNESYKLGKFDPEGVRERTDEISAPARQAFTSWQHDENKRLYLKQIADSGMEHSDIIHYYSHCRPFVSSSDGTHHKEFSLVRSKIPIGVILLIVNTTEVDLKSIASLITPALALGNAVIVLFEKAAASVQSLISTFNKILPKNVLNAVVGVKQWLHLASDPNIQAVWLYGTACIEFSEALCNFNKNSKRVWIVPKPVPRSQALFQKECLQNKVVWLTKVDQFP